MSEPSLEELTDSIQALSQYRDRLRKEVISISKKLRITQSQVNSLLDEHHDLNKIEDVIERLISQKEKMYPQVNN